ncbi:ATP-binding protein [Amaricoccus tamworthensis]|uniref:ATP-binding protein n=1 Tax=Amaricoccus tamworthensis TaxID=57002 RepID=UPI003C7CCF58
MLRDTIRITLIGLLLLLVTAGAVGGIFFKATVAKTQERELKSFANYLDIGVLQARQEIDEAKRRLLFIAETRPIQGLIRARANGGTDPQGLSTEQQWTERLENLFSRMVALNSYILQIRLIGLEDSGREIVRVDRQGEEVTIVEETDLQRKAHRPYFQQTIALGKGEIYSSSIELNMEHGAIVEPWVPVLRVATPIHSPDGKLFGIMVINLDGEYLLQAIRSAVPPSADLIVADYNGNILLHHDPKLRFSHLVGDAVRLQDLYPDLKRLVENPESVDFSGVLTSGRDNKYVVHARHLRSSNTKTPRAYIAALTIPNDILNAGIMDVRKRIVVIALAFCFVSAVLFFHASWRFTDPITRLEAASRTILDGTSPGRIVWPQTNNETVQNLSNAFSKTVTALHDREVAISENLERLETILNGTEDAILLLDSDGNIETANRAAKKMFGYDTESLIGKDMCMLVPLLRNELQDEYLRAIDISPEESLKTGKHPDLTGRRQDGSTFDIELTVSRTFRDQHTKHIVFIKDVSERRGMARLKSEFVATVSHELRTPLAAIKGSLGLLQSGTLGTLNDMGQEFLNASYSNCTRLISLINDILDIEKMESGRMRFDFDSIDLRDVISTAVSECRGMAEPKEIALHTEFPEVPAITFADHGRLVQVVTNLVSNAVKFSNPGSPVTVAVCRRDRHWCIEVRDQGPGIPAGFHDSLFERFTQAEGATNRTAGGSGLGLAITKAIVDTHKGSISFDTGASGTTFFISLIATDATPVRKIIDTSVSRGSLLLCEGDGDIATFLDRTLTDAGFDVTLAYTAEAARELLNQSEHDAVFVDWTTSDGLGRQLTEHMASLPRENQAPVIAVRATGRTATETSSEFENLTLCCIEKPLTTQMIIDAIDSVTSFDLNRPARILQVEDEPDHQRLLRELLDGMAEVSAAGTLREARELLKTETFDLVLLDQFIPDGLGTALIEDLNDLPNAPDVMIFSIEMPPHDIQKLVASSLMKSRVDNNQLVTEIKHLLRTTRHSKRSKTD